MNNSQELGFVKIADFGLVFAFGLVWFGLAWCSRLVGLVWFGLVWFGLVWFGLVCCVVVTGSSGNDATQSRSFHDPQLVGVGGGGGGGGRSDDDVARSD